LYIVSQILLTMMTWSVSLFCRVTDIVSGGLVSV